MAVFRIEKTRDYTVMSNHHLRDMSLSLKAKGLLSLMLSLPENWDYTMKGLARICKDGIDSISGGIRELEEHGYLIRERVRGANGQLGSIEYTILEQPKEPTPAQEKPIRENPVQANPTLVGFLVGTILYGVYTPVAIKYGITKARLVFTAAILLMSLGPILTIKVFRSDITLILSFMQNTSGTLVPIILGIAGVGIFLISMIVSIRIFAKKEL